MKLTQYKVIHILLALAILPGIILAYLLLTPSGHPGMPSSGWTFFCVGAGALIVAAFLPSWLRKRAGNPPPPPMSRAAIGYLVMVTIVGIFLTLFGTMSGMSGLVVLGIMLAPLSFIFRPKGIQ